MDAEGIDKNSAQYMALQREIVETEDALKKAERAFADVSAEIASNEKSVSKTQAAYDKLKESLEKVSVTSKKVSEATAKASQKTRKLSTAASAALAGIAGIAYKAVTGADDLVTLANQTGFTTDELQKMKYASDLVDVSLETITGSAAKMTKKLATSEKSFNDLGVETRTANNDFRSTSEIFYDTIKALSGIENETERDMVAMDIFGKSANELAGIIDDGGESLRQFGQEAENAGIILDGDTLTSLNNINDTIDKLKAKGAAKLAEAGANALEALSPVLDSVVDGIEKVLNVIGDLTPEQMKVIIAVLAVIAVISPLLLMVSKVAAAIAFLASPIGLAIVAIGALIAAGVWLYKNWDVVKQKAEEFGEALQAAWENVKTWTTETWSNIKTTITSKFNAAKTAIALAVSNIKFQVSAAWGKVKADTLGAWENVKTSVNEAIENAKATITTTVEDIKTTTANAWQNVLSKARSMWTSIKNAITKPFNDAKATISSIIETIKGWFPISIGKIFSNIKLPHFSITEGESILGISIPKISVSWYRKAMDNAIMLNGASIFGMMGGKMLAGGEAGREVVVSYDKLAQMLGGNGGGNTATTNISVTVNAAPGMDERLLADYVARRIQQKVNQKGAVWA